MAKIFPMRLESGLPIGAQDKFAECFNMVLDILENCDGVNGVTITKDGVDFRWEGSGSGITGAPSLADPSKLTGATWETLNILTVDGVRTRRVLVAQDGRTTTDFTAADERGVLQINSTGKVIVDSGYLK